MKTNRTWLFAAASLAALISADTAAAQAFLANTPAVSMELKEKLLAPRK